jgi:hypothetical protein
MRLTNEVYMPEKVNVTHEDKHPHLSEACKHFKAAHESIHKSMEELLPKGTIEHHRAARKEMLLAFRSLLDAAIEHAEKTTR